MFTILVVCTANMCRSPMAEAFFRRALEARGLVDGRDFAVWSAGTSARPGATIVPHAQRELERRDCFDGAHAATAVSPEALAGADLVVTMAADHLREAALMAPEARARIFTLKELAELLRERPRGGGLVDEREAIVALDEIRGPLPMSSSSLDVADPIGGPPAAFAGCAAELEELVEEVATGLWGPSSSPPSAENRIAAGPDGEADQQLDASRRREGFFRRLRAKILR